MTSNASTDQQLIRILQSVGEYYDAACTLARELEGRSPAGLSADLPALTQLQQLLRRMPQADRELSEARFVWERGGRPTGPELRRAVDEHRVRLEQLLELVNQCICGLKTTRERLRPELDLTLRRESMRLAYGRSSHT